MQIFDASSIIYAWDNYPISQFPGLWEWLASEIKKKNLVMPSVAVEEVENKTPDCCKWLKENELEQLKIGNSILREAIRIKGLLGIADDRYHSKGVGENDIFIIASTRISGAELVSNEGRQNLEVTPAKRKIPAVCAMKEVSIPCVNFIEYIKRSKVVFC
ncbi:DUF4411 domain-containing protein [Gammaproteobacteria bacterium]